MGKPDRYNGCDSTRSRRPFRLQLSAQAKRQTEIQQGNPPGILCAGEEFETAQTQGCGYSAENTATPAIQQGLSADLLLFWTRCHRKTEPTKFQQNPYSFEKKATWQSLRLTIAWQGAFAPAVVAWPSQQISTASGR